MNSTEYAARALNWPRHGCRLLLLLLLTAASDWLAAQSWDELTPAEQNMLLPWAEQWQDMADDERAQMLQGLRQWQQMTPDERLLARQRFTQWQSLTPAQRERLRQRFQRFRAMTPAQQARVRAGMQRLRALSPEQRQRLRQRWQQMSPDQRRAFRDGARLGVHSERLGWMLQLEDGEREALWALVADLSPVQRQLLRQRMQPLDDAARRTLARRLLAATADEREQLLQAPAD